MAGPKVKIAQGHHAFDRRAGGGHRGEGATENSTQPENGKDTDGGHRVEWLFPSLITRTLKFSRHKELAICNKRIPRGKYVSWQPPSGQAAPV